MPWVAGASKKGPVGPQRSELNITAAVLNRVFNTHAFGFVVTHGLSGSWK